MRRWRFRRSLRVNLFLQMGQANLPCSSSDGVLVIVAVVDNLISGEAAWTGLGLTVGLVPSQILYAAEILGTSWALESLTRSSRRGLWFCRVLCWPIRGPLGVALPRISTAAAAARRSLHLDLGQAPTCTWHRRLWGELTRGADSCGRGQREQMLPRVGHFCMAIGAMIWGWVAMCSWKKWTQRRQTQTAATDATDGLAVLCRNVS